ncbi:hypothetical protein ACGFIG_00475 [Micromonospora sp. NPDC049048]|uniref:hypothetical protein n=1 Tax=Micromonospora sp. NPDC049048 TaxID=3364263 RepID=UPI0037111EB5
MTRVLRTVAAVLVSAALAACGSDGEPATPPPPASDVASAPSSSAAPSSTAAPSSAAPSSAGTPSSAGPAPSAAGSRGYANPDAAIAGHLAAVPGVRYLGLCKNAKRDPAAFCALRMGFVGQDEVYGLGAPHSDVVAFLLLSKGPGGWRVVDDHTPDGGTPAPPWMADVG